jgi:hypothetical protein
MTEEKNEMKNKNNRRINETKSLGKINWQTCSKIEKEKKRKLPVSEMNWDGCADPHHTQNENLGLHKKNKLPPLTPWKKKKTIL